VNSRLSGQARCATNSVHARSLDTTTMRSRPSRRARSIGVTLKMEDWLGREAYAVRVNGADKPPLA
jgi:hypothetical protein